MSKLTSLPKIGDDVPNNKMRITNKEKPGDEFVLRSVRVRKAAYDKVRLIALRTGRSITDILQIAIENIE